MTAAPQASACKSAVQRGWHWLESVVRQMRCHHEWRKTGSDRFDVLRGDKTKEGEVTITLYECRCGKDKLMASDRTHLPNAEVSDRAGDGARIALEGT